MNICYKIMKTKKLKQSNDILKSQKDKDIFFDTILNPKEPSEILIKAAKKYKSLKDKNES